MTYKPKFTKKDLEQLESLGKRFWQHEKGVGFKYNFITDDDKKLLRKIFHAYKPKSIRKGKPTLNNIGENLIQIEEI